jgi:hypothetical protein
MYRHKSLGYTRQEYQKIVRFQRLCPEGDLLEIVACDCTESYTCYPCYLNNLRRHYGINNTATDERKTQNSLEKTIQSFEDCTSFEATEWKHHFCGQR